MRFYFAGKIGKNDWRHDIVKGLRVWNHIAEGYTTGKHCDPWAYDHTSMPNADAFLPRAICGAHDYCGPFFVSCDHGCCHGDNRHGVMAAGDAYVCMEQRSVYQSASPKEDGVESRRAKTFKNSLYGIDHADVVFVWLESWDAFGTLVEIGAARAWGKEIWVASPPGKIPDDLWFAVEAASQFTDRFTLASEAFDFMLRQYGESVAHPSESWWDMQGVRTERELLRVRLQELQCAIRAVIAEAEEIAGKGQGAPWREILSRIVCKPLRVALEGGK